MINYKNIKTVSKELFQSLDISDEIIYKEMINQLLGELSIADLSKIFSLTKIDPFSEKNQKALLSNDTPMWLRDRLTKLFNDMQIEYEVNLKI